MANTSGKLLSKRIEVEDSAEAFYEMALQQSWSDGLPMVPPTEERVRRMTDYVGGDPQDSLGVMPPANYEATIERVAINAVMAGCRPEYMPVIIAGVEAMLDPLFNLGSVQTTTNPVAPLMIVNGPVRTAIGLNCGSSVFAPGCRANATIGRAIRLILLNVGGSIPGTVSKSTQGQPSRYGLCIGEAEEESPWAPHHVDLGFARDKSTVTMVAVTGNINVFTTAAPAEALLQQIANSTKIAGSNNFTRGKGPSAVVMNPDHALTLQKAGYSKEAAREYLHINSKVPQSWFHKGHLDYMAVAGENKLDADGMFSQSRDIRDFILVVAGGRQGLHSTFLPSFAVGVEAITREILTPRGS